MSGETRPSAEPSRAGHVVVAVAAGIGNAVMTVPLVRQLKQTGVAERLTVAAKGAGIAAVFDRLVEVDQVRPMDSIGDVRDIAAQKPGVLLLPFPANRWQYRVLASLAGAPRVVTHAYPRGGFFGASQLPRLLGKTLDTVPAVAGRHDVLQNLDLLGAFHARPPRDRPTFPLTEDERASVDNAMRGAVVLHAGCADTPIGRVKRPPIEFFGKLCDALGQLRSGRRVVVIEGPDERGIAKDVARHAKLKPDVVALSGTLGESAAAIAEAACYVGVDSGLAHLAGAVGTAPITLFAAADPARVCPFGYAHLVVLPRPAGNTVWKPLSMYPMEAAGPKIRASEVDWTRRFAVEDVMDRIGSLRL